MTTEVSPQQARHSAVLTLVSQDFEQFLHYVVVRDDQQGKELPFEPWPHLLRFAKEWEEGRSQIHLKARQLGVSWLVASYQLWKAMYKRQNVLALSKSQIDSRELLRRSKFIYSRLPDYLQIPYVTERLDEVEFAGGGRILSLASTEDAGRGFTAALAIFDEFAFHPFARQNYAAIYPTVGDNGQILVISTSNGPAGRFYELWDNAEFDTVFEPWSARPGRDQAWYESAKRAFTGMDSEFLREFPSNPREAFTTPEGLVYPQFSGNEGVYTYTTSGRASTTGPMAWRPRWEDARYRLVGIDPGGGDPTAVIPLGITRDGIAFQPSELYGHRISTEDIVEYLKDFEDAGIDRILIDTPEDSPWVTEFRHLGYPAHAADKERRARLITQGTYLDQRRLRICADTCPRSIAEFYGYRWAERTDPHSKDRYKTSTPVDHHADAMDARGYCLLYASSRLGLGDIDEFGDILPAIDDGPPEGGYNPFKRLKGLF